GHGRSRSGGGGGRRGRQRQVAAALRAETQARERAGGVLRGTLLLDEPCGALSPLSLDSAPLLRSRSRRLAGRGVPEGVGHARRRVRESAAVLSADVALPLADSECRR